MINRSIFIVFLMFFLIKDIHSSGDIYTLNLKETMAMALKNNKRLLSFKEKIKFVSFQIKESSSKLYPRLDLKSGLNYTKFLEKRKYEIVIGGEKFTQIIEEKPYSTSVGIHLSQTLFDAGKTRAEIKRAEENLKEVKVEYELLKQEVIVEVVEAYYNLVKTIKKKEAYQKEKERTKDLYNITHAKLKEGLIPEVDEKRARLNLMEAEGRVTTAKNAQDIAQEHLKMLLGLPLHSLVSIEEQLPEFKPIEFEIDGIISKALNNNLEIKRAQINLNKEIFSKKIAKSLYWPQVTLDTNYTWQGINKTLKRSLDEFKEYQLGISLNITMPIFDGGYIRSQTKQAETSLAETKIKLDQIKERVIFDIKEKAIKVKEAEEMVAIQKNTLILAEENFKIIKAKYEEGMASLTEVFEANKTLTEIFTNYIAALCNFSLNKIKFYIAIGEIDALL